MVDLYERSSSCRNPKRDEIIRDLHACQEHRPRWPWSIGQGHHQLPLPNDIIVDASMPAMIRQGGKMWAPTASCTTCKAVDAGIDLARIYQEMINFCKWNGNFDPKHHGYRAERRPDGPAGRGIRLHDKTFEIPEDGIANIVDIESGEVLMTQTSKPGIFGACARSRTRRPRLGQACRQPAPAIPARPWCSGSIPTAPRKRG